MARKPRKRAQYVLAGDERGWTVSKGGYVKAGPFATDAEALAWIKANRGRRR